MKLYTEEQVLNMLRSFHNLEMNVQLCMLKLTPIELPSDDDIEEKSNDHGFFWGAKWMKEQILNQNK